MKICSTCKTSKIEDDFYKGYARCKKCHYAATEKYRKANLMQSRTINRRYNQNNPDISKESRSLAKKNWKLKNPKKYSAGNRIYAAIRDGKIKRDNCCVCRKLYGKEVLAHAHHCDYNKPYDVVFLCPLHHRAWHNVFLTQDTEVAA